ncbi:MAG TPA: TIGR03619 family F420-dependent LLM class oxidoreductase [Acidimicrobiales bacterium]|nr:TIGR03619 family F420-dependent LLM class oxidoreductase [Acidimicrobiales bacterium]
MNLILGEHTLAMLDVAPLVDERPIDALFLGEHTHTPVATSHPDYPAGLPDFYKRFLDPFVQLSVAAAVTTRVRIGTGIVLVAERNPLELAKAVASLDVVSGGRVELGVGLGWNPLELRNNGIDPPRRRAVFREKLRALRMLWRDDVASFSGEFVRFGESWSYPKPLQRPNPPVLVGAAACGATFRDVLGLAEGWYPLAHDAILDDLDRLAALGPGRLPAVTIVEMDGQRPGAPWAFEDAERGRALERAALGYADRGVHRLSVGVPCDDTDRLQQALDHLSRLAQRTA